MPHIVVSGALANKPLHGGEAWVRLSWIQGLKKLGFQVYFVEQIARETCVDARGTVVPFGDSVNLAYFREVVEQFGLSDSAALIYDNGEQFGEQLYGLREQELFELAESAALLVNISGHLTWPPLMERLRLKAYIDIDPGFTQFWHAEGNPGAHLAGHDYFFTIGENIGQPGCTIPTGGIPWRAIRQPVVLEDWPVTDCVPPRRFTTIASWRGPFGTVTYAGRTFGLKVHEFRKFVELPERSDQVFEIALNIHPADHKDLNSLLSHGWQIVDPGTVARDPAAFRHYIQGSGAEFSVAQGIYVDTDSGWFSDRSVRYLASGKPVLVQDTGFSRQLPVGEGLVPFRSLDEAAAGAERIAGDYDRHCRAARALAEQYFDSDRVLGRMLEQVGI